MQASEPSVIYGPADVHTQYFCDAVEFPVTDFQAENNGLYFAWRNNVDFTSMIWIVLLRC